MYQTTLEEIHKTTDKKEHLTQSMRSVKLKLIGPPPKLHSIKIEESKERKMSPATPTKTIILSKAKEIF